LGGCGVRSEHFQQFGAGSRNAFVLIITVMALWFRISTRVGLEHVIVHNNMYVHLSIFLYIKYIYVYVKEIACRDRR
jgi:hypothetical protein